MNKKLLLFIVISVLLLIVAIIIPAPTHAEDSCGDNADCVVNNNNNENNNRNIQEMHLEMPSVVNVSGHGRPVYAPPRYIRSTPSTGPEALALFVLLPAGLAGYLLRKE